VLHAVSQRLLDALAVDATEAAPSILEVGCGGGGLSISLLERGATSATGVDLSTVSIEVARLRAEAAGLTARTRFELGDGASVRLVPHDWVVLDRVLCCYPDLDRLLGNSVSAAQKRYAFSPASSGWRGFANRIWFGLEDATEGLRGRPCRGYVHDIRRIEARLMDAGFRSHQEQGGAPLVRRRLRPDVRQGGRPRLRSGRDVGVSRTAGRRARRTEESLS